VSKILVFSVPAHGHVNPTLPVVRELVSRGEQVAYYLTGEFEPQIRHIGAEFAASRTFNQVPVPLLG
jgi:UDP:flavonoid glycosyltransferase YjiC (YdhE family)